MSSVMKALILALCMNICLTLMGISLGGADVLGQFVSVNNDTVSPTQQFSFVNGSAIPTDPNQAIGSTVLSGDTFIDTLKLTFNMLLMVMVGLFLPVYWGFALGLPLWLTLLLVVQTIFGVVSMIMVIRGTGS